MENDSQNEDGQARQNNQTVGMVEPEEFIDPPSNAHCPSCNGPGIRKGKTIACQMCNCSFRYTKEGPRVEEIGPFDKLEARVAILEGGTVEGIGKRILAAQPPEPAKAQPPEPAKAPPAEPVDDGI